MSRWQDAAVCRDDPLWDRKPRRRQLADCDECPVGFHCLQAALADEEAEIRSGEASISHLIAAALPVYGGHTIQQRARILAGRVGEPLDRLRQEPGEYDTCGTPAGAVKHTRLGERRCDACSAAASADRKARRQVLV